MRALSQLGRRAEMRTSAPDIGRRLPAGRGEFLSRADLIAAAGRAGNFPRTLTRAAGRAPTLQRVPSAHASAACTLLFTPAKMAGVPNPYFQLIISNSRPGIARFTAKLVYTISNREIPLTTREDTEIRPKIP